MSPFPAMPPEIIRATRQSTMTLEGTPCRRPGGTLMSPGIPPGPDQGAGSLAISASASGVLRRFGSPRRFASSTHSAE